MKATVEPLDGNKVRLSVEVDEGELDKAVDAAFRKIARDVRIPGFRPGKAPRRVLEAKIGAEAAREEALREGLPEWYVRALREHDVDAIAPPEIDVTSGREGGPLAFDAVVEVRPRVSIPGYEGLQVAVPSPEVTDDDVDHHIDRLRAQTGELTAVERPAKGGDFVTIDLKGERDGEPVEGLAADDYLYEVGTDTVVPELDARLHGAKVGDILAFEAEVPGAGEGPVSFRVFVKDIKERVLPEVTDEWAAEASELETVEELRADIRHRLGEVKRVQAVIALRDGALRALAELVTDDPPPALVDAEVERRVHDLQHRLHAQGADLGQYLAATGRSGEELVAELREGAVDSVKADLALRALAEAEGLEVTDDDVDREVAAMAERAGVKPAELRRQLDRAEQVPAVRSDIRKGKALEWLMHHAEVVDDEGRPVERDALLPPGERADGERAETDELSPAEA